jgi:hypothetical protein
MSFHDTMNPDGGVDMGRIIEVPDLDEHIRLVGEHLLSGYGPIGFMNRLVRTRCRVVWGLGEKNPRLPDSPTFTCFCWLN